MSESFDDNEPIETGDGARLRIKGIVDNPDRAVDTSDTAEPVKNFEGWIAEEAAFRDRDWTRAAERVTYWSRFVAIFILAVMLIGWPAGTLVGHYNTTGSLSNFHLGDMFPTGAVLFASVVPVIIIMLGYMFAKQMRMMSAAESIATVAQQFMQPDETAIYNVDAVGHAVRGQMEAINSGIDDALIRLASVEAMIRKHVDAIDAAGVAIESHTTGAVTRVADERSRLIALTEQLNAKADDFATAIALKAQAGIEAINESTEVSTQAEQALESRLQRLEGASMQALESFGALTKALGEADANIMDRAHRIDNSAQEIKRSTESTARAADAAAESAARNAANLASIAKQAANTSKTSADEAIQIAQQESERTAGSAIEFATREAERVAEAAASALETVKNATSSAVVSAAEDATKATDAADQVGEAAQKAMEAAQRASDEVRKASEAAHKSAEDALTVSKAAKEHSETQQKQLLEARASLEAENARLEKLIEEQRQRADRLADAIANQTDRLSKLAEAQLREQEAALQTAQIETRPPHESEAPKPQSQRPTAIKTKTTQHPGDHGAHQNRLDEMAASIARPKSQSKSQHTNTRVPPEHHSPQPSQQPKNAPEQGRRHSEKSKSDVSWREILTATDDAAPIELQKNTQREQGIQQAEAKAPDADEAMKIIYDLQSFTFVLENQLYGEPPVALQERFERGDRNIFANRLLRLNESDVKRRIRMEAGRNKNFDRAIHEFLQGFEKLLEDATTSETADEELEEYLSSALGRVYLLIGATVGYFA